MNLRSQPVRLAAAVGAVIAAGTTTFFALAAGTASADEPGRCTQNVNVREEPDATSRIVALCESGTQVMLGAEQDGWVRLDEQGGWASKEFVKADEPTSGSSSGSGSGSSSDRDEDESSSSSRPSGERSSDGSSARDRSGDSDRSGSSGDRDADRSSSDDEAGSSSDDLGGLLD